MIFKIRVRRGIALRGASLKHQIWLRQTVAALPRPDQSLRSAFRCRWLGKIKSTRACAHCNEWLEAGGWLWFRGVAAPHRNAARPALSPRRGSRFWFASKFAFDSVFQVSVAFASTAIVPSPSGRGLGGRRSDEGLLTWLLIPGPPSYRVAAPPSAAPWHWAATASRPEGLG